jgi:hypothetical protein
MLTIRLNEFFREENESGDYETRDSFSDSCSDESESEKLWRWDGCSSEDGGSEQDNLCHLNDRLGDLYFRYFERSTPYARVPLMDKVLSLAFHLFLSLSLSFSLIRLSKHGND